MKRKTSTLQVIRNIIQLVCFLIIPGLFIDSFNGIKTLIQTLVDGSANAATLVPALFPSILLIAATMIFGRFFCGFMCAFGTLGDAIHFIGKKVFKINFRMSESSDRKLKWVKYILLAFLVFTWITGIGVLSGWSPWDAFGALVALPPDFSFAFTSFTIGSILLALIVVGSLFVERFFCRYFCPMGAIFSIFSKLRIAKIRKARTSCGKCHICTSNCKMGIPLYQSDVVNSGECIGCLKCITPCPRSNAKLTVASKDAAPLMASVAAASMIGLYHVGNIGVTAFENSTDTAVVETLSDSSSAQAAESDTASSEAPQATEQTTNSVADTSAQTSSGYVDGTYEGSGTGFRNRTTTVSVTISNGQITDIQTVSTGDDGKFYNRAFSTVISDIISEQSTSVSAVSGATFSSKGIMSAVASALAQAKA